jgi:hypothetical protein
MGKTILGGSTYNDFYFGSSNMPASSQVQVVSSSDTVITSHGVTLLDGIAARSYTTMKAPLTGVRKVIINKSSTAAVSVNLGVTIAYSTATATDTPHILTFTTQATPSSVELIGLSTALWGLIGSLGGVSLSS